MFVGMTTCLLLYVIFPNGLDLRVEITPAQSLCRDRPADAAGGYPHQCLSVYPCGVVHGDGSGTLPQCAGSEALGTACFPWDFIAIVLSTLFLKQHSVIDVFWGIGSYHTAAWNLEPGGKSRGRTGPSA